MKFRWNNPKYIIIFATIYLIVLLIVTLLFGFVINNMIIVGQLSIPFIVIFCIVIFVWDWTVAHRSGWIYDLKAKGKTLKS